MKHFLLALCLIALPIAAFTGFEMKFASMPAGAASGSSLGDLSALKTIVTDIQAVAGKGDLVAAEKRARDFESAWDLATNSLRAMNKADWGNIDDASDAMLKAVREKTPDAKKVNETLATLMAALNDPSKAP